MIETTFLAENYVTRTRQVLIPKGHEYHGVGKYLPNGLRPFDNIEVKSEVVGSYVKISMSFRPIRAEDAMTYYVRFEEIATKGNFIHIPLVTLRMGLTRFTSEVVCWLTSQPPDAITIKFTCSHCVLRSIMLYANDSSMRKVDEDKYHLRKLNDEQSIIDLDTKLITLHDFGDYILMVQNDDCGEEQIKALTLKGMGQTQVTSQVVYWLPPQNLSAPSINFTCARCELRAIMLRVHDGSMHSVDEKKYQLRKFKDEQSVIDLEIRQMTPIDLGDYFLMVQDDDCGEEQIKALTLKVIQVRRLRANLTAKPQYENVTYTCADCKITDMLCKGVSVLTSDKFKLDPVTKTIVVYIYNVACVYVGIFTIGDTPYRKTVAIIIKVNITGGGRIILPPPAEGAPFEHKIYFSCKDPCFVEMVTVNGIPLFPITQRSNTSLGAYFSVEHRTMTVIIPQYTSLWEGMYLASFLVNGSRITKDVMEIGPKENQLSEFLSAYVYVDLEVEEEDEIMPTPQDSRRKHQPPGTRRSGGKTEESCTVHILRDAVQAGHAYKQKIVEYACPGGQLVAISCRGQNVTTGLGISTNNTVSIDFDQFEDTNACVYLGIFKINQTEHRRTLAVLEMISVTVSTVEPSPPSGEFKHKVVYTCNVAKCDPAMIYINDKTLKSDDENSLYSYKSEMVKRNDKEIVTVTIDFTIKTFTKEYEGLYQLVVTNGTERVTKNIMEIGALP